MIYQNDRTKIINGIEPDPPVINDFMDVCKYNARLYIMCYRKQTQFSLYWWDRRFGVS